MGDEFLATKAGIDAHHEQQVQISEHLNDTRQRRRRVQRHAGAAAHLADVDELSLKMGRYLLMDGNAAGASCREIIEVSLGLHDHQVTVEGQIGELANRLDDLRAECNVRNELTIHDVDVNPVGAPSLAHRDLVRQTREVRRKYARRDAGDVIARHGPYSLPTRSVIFDPAVTCAPAAGD